MKKLYFLNEEEKQRILNIHESATSRQYLSEQIPFGPQIPPNPYKTALDNMKGNANWEGKYSCVPSQGVKPTKLKDGSTMYIINGVKYYSNGRKKLVNGTITNYTCATEFKSGASTGDKAKKQQQYKQQIITKTSDTTKQIQKLLELPETGVMDSSLLQKINEKLNPQKRPEVQAINPSTLQPAGLANKPLNAQAGFQDQVNQISKMLQQQQLQQQQLNTPKNKKK